MGVYMDNFWNKGRNQPALTTKYKFFLNGPDQIRIF